MNGNGFLKRLKRLGKQTGDSVRFAAARGKGSHGRVYFGARHTTLKDRRQEIGKGLLAAMLRDLGIDKGDL